MLFEAVLVVTLRSLSRRTAAGFAGSAEALPFGGDQCTADDKTNEIYSHGQGIYGYFMIVGDHFGRSHSSQQSKHVKVVQAPFYWMDP